MTTIIDYGAGNLHSVQNALARLGEQSAVTGNPDDIMAAERVILPGVGSFGDAMTGLRQAGLDRAVVDFAESGKPLLGICLGLHLMFEESEESPNVQGLGIFRGKVKKIPKYDGIKIPHMGWNDLKMTGKSKILDGLGDTPYVYFVHSYYINAVDDIVSAYTEYGQRLDIAVERENVFAVQFHPEKSGSVGMKILKNFLSL